MLTFSHVSPGPVVNTLLLRGYGPVRINNEAFTTTTAIPLIIWNTGNNTIMKSLSAKMEGFIKVNIVMECHSRTTTNLKMQTWVQTQNFGNFYLA